MHRNKSSQVLAKNVFIELCLNVTLPTKKMAGYLKRATILFHLLMGEQILAGKPKTLKNEVDEDEIEQIENFQVKICEMTIRRN